MFNTIAIESTKRPEGWVLINEDDFNPRVHVLWTKAKATVKESLVAPVTEKADEAPTEAPDPTTSGIVVTTTTEVSPALDKALGLSTAPVRDEYSLPKEISFNRRPVGRPKKEKE